MSSLGVLGKSVLVGKKGTEYACMGSRESAFSSKILTLGSCVSDVF